MVSSSATARRSEPLEPQLSIYRLRPAVEDVSTVDDRVEVFVDSRIRSTNGLGLTTRSLPLRRTARRDMARAGVNLTQTLATLMAPPIVWFVLVAPMLQDYFNRMNRRQH